MTTLNAYSGTARFDSLFATIVGFCADFCAGARQGGYPRSPLTAARARRH